ncbi:AAA family ATPase [Campylobacter corcagiensis]|uniref:DNA repair protein RecN n=1 Tax=Campylobacter corcagiensis TaxID=1448857 RepID=A0A7M1LH55_9BACT|nr:AAA family ATPase [Campylobacter corcagiensis]QKF64450.1 DNA repair protein RecN [Campylobacter corcagiensis]QOQ87364.1 AAA family ATPase [Campylobacter corcagiensis]
MITRLLIKNHLSFKEVELKFDKGLSVFTGASGAGKSVLMEAILAAFGLVEASASLIEADVNFKFDMSEYGILNEPINSFKMVKEKSTRYFINNQFVAKKNLTQIANEHIKYLSVRDTSEFENKNLLNLLDNIAIKNSKTHKKNLTHLAQIWKEFSEVKSELERIKAEELKLAELKEFAKFEIEKIEKISPKVGEFEELMELKKLLSKKDKIESAWSEAYGIFSFESRVVEALRISGQDASFFEEAMNELRAKKDELNLDELENIDIEKTLDRIEDLSSLEKRYGSIEEALKALDRKKFELAHYENIEFTKNDLERKFKELKINLENLANLVSSERKKAKIPLEKLLNSYLKELYMSDLKVIFSSKNIDNLGSDSIGFEVLGTELKNLSSGELNRLRLAFIASSVDILGFANGVLILDEIDANLSGKEAMSIANVLTKLAKFYQIFAISHLPQLSSKANSHFLITKNNEISSVTKLDENAKITELARMISGETISQEAINFAKKLKND